MFRAFVLASLLVAAFAGCASKKDVAAKSPIETLDAVLAPDAFVAALRKAGGGHFHATALFRVEATRKADPSEGKPASPPAITTTTDLWLDRQGNFRLVESNDQEGGREIVRVGREIAVALRYGKMVKRTAQDAESARFLAEAVGAPATAWEIVRRQVEVKGSGNRYELALASRMSNLPAGVPVAEGLQKWRQTIDVKSVAGSVALDRDVPIAFDGKASFRASRDDLPVDGEVAVSATVAELGKVADVTMPDAETLHTRQRTILEEKALLGGIRSSAPVPAATPKKEKEKPKEKAAP